MATKIKVESKGREHHVLHAEINAGASGYLGTGSHVFEIGAIKSSVHYLTIKRESAGTIKVVAETGDINVEVDHQDKLIKKGHSITLPNKFGRVVVWEKPQAHTGFHSTI